MSVFKSYAEMSPDQRVAYDLGRLSVEQRLADTDRILASVQEETESGRYKAGLWIRGQIADARAALSAGEQSTEDRNQ